jgi:DNA-binding response OmpR family regulator
MKKIEKKYNISLLYVEDEHFIRKNAVEFLSDRFEIIYEAEDGKEALELYFDNKPDSIITDIKMPNLDGLELCKEIRESDETTPIIITTAFTNQEYLLKAIELNLIKYIIKPIDEDELNEALDLSIQKIKTKTKSVARLTKEHYFDIFNKTLTCKGQFLRLSSKELDFLLLLANNKNRVVTYKEIENYVYGGDFMSEDALKGLVKNLRKKISKEFIENYSKQGYMVKLYHG